MLLLVCSSALLAILQFDTIPVGPFFYDDAQYVVLAESLATGRGYHLINFPDPQPTGIFPPGWPLLLVPVVALFPGNLILLKLVATFFWFASIPLVYRLYARHFRSPYLEVLLALVVLSPHLIVMSVSVMSEAAYFFFSLLTLNLFEIWEQSKSKRKAWLLIGVVFLALFTLTIRTIGVTLLLGILLHLLLTRRFRYLSLIAGVLSLGLFPLLWFNWQQGGNLLLTPAYVQNFRSVLAQLGQSARFWNYSALLLDGSILHSIVPVLDLRLTAIGNPALWRLFNAGGLLILTLGFLLSLRRRQASEVYVGLYLALFYFWATWAGRVQIRLLLPMIPFFFFYLLQTVDWLGSRFTGQNKRWAKALGVTVLSLLMLLGLARNYYEWSHPKRDRLNDLSLGTTWLRENAPTDSIIMTPDPVPDYLYIGRPTVFYPGYRVEIDRYIKSKNIDYILVKPKIQSQSTNQLSEYVTSHLLPFLMSNPEQFQEVYRSPTDHVWVYEVKRID